MLGFTSLSESSISESAVSLQALAFLVSVPLTHTTADLLYTALANVTTALATSNGLAGSLLYDGDSNVNISSVSSAISLNALQEVFGKANTALDTTSVYLTIYANDFSDLDAKARIFIAPVSSASQATDLLYNAESNISISSIASQVLVSDVDYDAKAVNNSQSVLGTSSITPITTTAVRFDYDANDYETSRTYYLNTQDQNRTVIIR